MSLITDPKLEGLTVSEEGSTVTLKYTGKADGDQHIAVQGVAAWKTDSSSETIFYYEVAVQSTDDAVGVGLAQSGFPNTTRMPGWIPGSYAYHGDDGNRFVGGRSKPGWPTFKNGAVAGLGVKASTGEIFGTLDGKYLGLIAAITDQSEYFPTIGLNSPTEVKVHFDKKDFKFDTATLPDPLVPAFGQLETTDRTTPKLLVLHLNGVEDAEKEKLKGQLEAFSKEARTKHSYQSFYTSETDKIAKGIREFVGIYDRSPLLVAVNLEENTKFAIPEGQEITTENIKKLVEDIAAGKVTSLKKSAPRPPNDKNPEHPTLTMIVGSTFDELVIQGTKDVLLDVYADWCGPCRAIAPTIAILSEIFDDNPNIVIAKIDCDANDIDRTYLPETSIPNIKLFRGANKTEPVKYKGNRSLNDFLEFLHTNATVTFDLEAAKAKGKSLQHDSEKKALKNVKPVHSADEFKEFLNTDKLVIVDYTAVWCGPCRAIAPLYAELSETYKDVVFLKVDVDEVKEVASAQGIECMPTFKVYKKGEAVGKIEGADPAELKKLITDNLITTA